MAKEYNWAFLQQMGKRLAVFRKAAGLSQEELANRTSLHRTYIGFIEQGKRDPSIGNLKKIASALDVPLDELFDFS